MAAVKSLLLVLCLGCVLVMGQTGLSDSDRQDILDAHNRLRGTVDPSASNMETMVPQYLSPVT